MSNAYYRTGLTGGSTIDLDQIAYTSLADGDIGFVITGNKIYYYRFDASSSAIENSPSIITPDLAGEALGRWIYQSTKMKEIIDKTDNAILTIEELNSQYTITNNDAIKAIILTWPTLANGQEAIFYVEDNQYLQIKASAITKIRIGEIETETGGYIRSNIVGNWVILKVINDTIIVTGSNGIWKYDK